MSKKETDKPINPLVLGFIIFMVILMIIGMLSKEKSKVTMNDVENELNKFREETENHPDKNMRSLGRGAIKVFESEIDEIKSKR